MQGEVSYREPDDQSSLVSDLESGNGVPAINHVANSNTAKKAVFLTSFVLFVAACIMLVHLMENSRPTPTQYDFYSPTAPNETENKRNSPEPTQGRLKSGDFLLSRIQNDQSTIRDGLQSKLENDNIDGSESVTSVVIATTVVNDVESTETSESIEDSSSPITLVSELDYQPTKTTLDDTGLDYYTSSTQEVPLQSFDTTQSMLSMQNVGVSEFDLDEEMKSTITSILETNLKSSSLGSSVAPNSITDETLTEILDDSNSSKLPTDSSNISNDGKMVNNSSSKLQLLPRRKISSHVTTLNCLKVDYIMMIRKPKKLSIVIQDTQPNSSHVSTSVENGYRSSLMHLSSKHMIQKITDSLKMTPDTNLLANVMDKKENGEIAIPSQPSGNTTPNFTGTNSKIESSFTNEVINNNLLTENFDNSKLSITLSPTKDFRGMTSNVLQSTKKSIVLDFNVPILNTPFSGEVNIVNDDVFSASEQSKDVSQMYTGFYDMTRQMPVSFLDTLKTHNMKNNLLRHNISIFPDVKSTTSKLFSLPSFNETETKIRSSQMKFESQSKVKPQEIWKKSKINLTPIFMKSLSILPSLSTNQTTIQPELLENKKRTKLWSNKIEHIISESFTDHNYSPETLQSLELKSRRPILPPNNIYDTEKTSQTKFISSNGHQITTSAGITQPSTNFSSLNIDNSTNTNIPLIPVLQGLENKNEIPKLTLPITTNENMISFLLEDVDNISLIKKRIIQRSINNFQMISNSTHSPINPITLDHPVSPIDITANNMMTANKLMPMEQNDHEVIPIETTTQLSIIPENSTLHWYFTDAVTRNIPLPTTIESRAPSIIVPKGLLTTDAEETTQLTIIPEIPTEQSGHKTTLNETAQTAHFLEGPEISTLQLSSTSTDSLAASLEVTKIPLTALVQTTSIHSGAFKNILTTTNLIKISDHDIVPEEPVETAHFSTIADLPPSYLSSTDTSHIQVTLKNWTETPIFTLFQSLITPSSISKNVSTTTIILREQKHREITSEKPIETTQSFKTSESSTFLLSSTDLTPGERTEAPSFTLNPSKSTQNSTSTNLSATTASVITEIIDDYEVISKEPAEHNLVSTTLESSTLHLSSTDTGIILTPPKAITEIPSTKFYYPKSVDKNTSNDLSSTDSISMAEDMIGHDVTPREVTETITFSIPSARLTWNPSVTDTGSLRGEETETPPTTITQYTSTSNSTLKNLLAANDSISTERIGYSLTYEEVTETTQVSTALESSNLNLSSFGTDTVWTSPETITGIPSTTFFYPKLTSKSTPMETRIGYEVTPRDVAKTTTLSVPSESSTWSPSVTDIGTFREPLTQSQQN